MRQKGPHAVESGKEKGGKKKGKKTDGAADGGVHKKPSAADLPAPKKAKKDSAVPDLGKVKPSSVVLSDDPTVEEVLAAHTSIYKYPKVLAKLEKKKPLPDRPKPSQDPTPYHGGRINTSKARNRLRVYKRSGDIYEQVIPTDLKKKTVVEKSWRLACAIIESDPRPVA